MICAITLWKNCKQITYCLVTVAKNQKRLLSYLTIASRYSYRNETAYITWRRRTTCILWSSLSSLFSETIRFLYAIGKNSRNSPDTFDMVLLHIQSFGDIAQDFAKCILFCIRDTAMRQDMWNRVQGTCRPVRDEDSLVANRLY